MTPQELVALLESLAELPYGSEAVDQRAHALQCAGHAIAAGADDDLVVAAALHDAGRAPSVRAQYPSLVHEAAGGLFCQALFGERVGWLVAAHVPAKRYLVTVDAGYSATLSPGSVRSLRVQGGPMTDTEATDFGTHRWADDAVRLRQWDEAAKVADAPSPSPEELRPWFERTSR